MKSILILICLLIFVESTIAQVGINTVSPTAELDVIGDTELDNSLFLENPGNNSVIRGSKLLIRSTANEILEYDIAISKYGPINYAQFILRELSTDGLQDYDTKISIDDYSVSIQGFYFLEASDGDTNVMPRSNSDNLNIEGAQIYAYKNTGTQTWFLKAFVNNAKFYCRDDNDDIYYPASVDMFLNIVIYRKGFISKEQSPITVSMGNNETGTATLPYGF